MKTRHKARKSDRTQLRKQGQQFASMSRQPEIKIEPSSTPSESRSQSGLWYAVATGQRSGIYNYESGAIQAVEVFGGHSYRKIQGRAAAIEYLRRKGVSANEIRIHQDTFSQRTNHLPNPTSSFVDEIKRLSSSQQWTREEFRQAQTDCLRDEIIRHYLPGGVRLKSEYNDEARAIELDSDETLFIYQGMCETAGKEVHNCIEESVRELKQPPYVNIIDFVDTCRTGQPISTFHDWSKFKKYTFKGRKIDVKSAKESEFLAPLLQNLKYGPKRQNLRLAKQKLEAARRKERQRNEPETPPHEPIKISQELPRELSPTVFDQPSSPTEAIRPALVSISTHQQRTARPNVNWKTEPRSSPQLPDQIKEDGTSSPITWSSSPITWSSSPEVSNNGLIVVSNKIEVATQTPAILPSSPILDSEISDTDWIELSMRFEAASQVPATTTERPVLRDQPSTAPVAMTKKRSRATTPLMHNRVKRQRHIIIE